MGDPVDAFDKILQESIKVASYTGETHKPIRKAEPKMPDALVFVRLVSSCVTCGRTHYAPNRRLLLRYGTLMVMIKEWRGIFNNAPREIITRKVRVQACEHCFENSNFYFSLNKEKGDTIG